MWLIAHGIVGRADLPIPVALFAAAAAAVLVVSFLTLAAGWSRPRLERRLARIPLVVEVVLGALGIAVFAVVVYAGLAGTGTQQDTSPRLPSTSASGWASRSSRSCSATSSACSVPGEPSAG